jgi:abortive infection bacteriophage resistance protein
MAPYAKVYLPVADQIALLKKRGMTVDDDAKAAEYLSRIGYYRLSAFWYPFREISANVVQDNFKADTNFRWATDLYAFDKGLRLRTGIALQLGKRDPWAHRDPANFDRSFLRITKTGRTAHDDWLARLDDKAQNSKEEFAVHHRQKYVGTHLPIWVAVELLDFGPLSMMLSGLRWNDLSAIASTAGVGDPKAFATWIRSLSVVRNVCAHHARMWNKPLVDQPKLPATGTIPALDHVASSPFANRRLYAACAIARYLLLAVNPRTRWSTRLKEHILTFPANPYVSIKTMGFPEKWDQLDLWK